MSISLDRAVVLGGLSMFLAGCAAQPDNVEAQYISTARYSAFDCEQVSMELERVSARVFEVTGNQQDAADGDAVATGVGLILFWPALFFLAGSDHSDELGRLKGEYEALEKVAIEKKCDISAVLAANQARKEAAQAAEEERRQKMNEPAPSFD